jgi:hypothetical protein
MSFIISIKLMMILSVKQFTHLSRFAPQDPACATYLAARRGHMAPKPATVGIVLAMALTILTAMTWASPSSSPIFGPQLLLLY